MGHGQPLGKTHADEARETVAPLRHRRNEKLSSMSTPTSTIPKSKLLPVGILLMVVGLLGRNPMTAAVMAMQPSELRGILLVLATDGLSLCFFAGLICALLGWLRNRCAQRNTTNSKK
jgi:hypothetical protein